MTEEQRVESPPDDSSEDVEGHDARPAPVPMQRPILFLDSAPEKDEENI